MYVREHFILLLLYQFRPIWAIDVETVKRCCSLGTNNSISGNGCSNFPTQFPGVRVEDSVPCRHSVEVCCKRKERDVQCEAGETLGLLGQDCNSADGAKKACCEACAFGKESFSANPSCDDYLGLGPSFIKCCQAALTSTTIRTTTTSTTTTSATTTPNEITSSVRTTSEYLPPSDNLCEVEGICAQICIPMGDSYKCDCNKGFSLMDDKISCKPNGKIKKGVNRCDMNNPCEQECVDTGVAIKCACREGYELDTDKTSCKDIDECALNVHECTKDEICTNDDGTYYCEDPSYTDTPIDFDKKCPTGYKFNGEKSVCDDIDECEIALLCPSPKICKNTMGSYTCEGEIVKCPPGFYYKAATESCMDVDECVSGENNCNKESQICVNTKGNYSCAEKVSTKTCPPGFKKNPYTQLCDDIDECASDVPLCSPLEECVNENGSYNCITTSSSTPLPYTSPTLRTTHKASIPSSYTTPYYPPRPQPTSPRTSVRTTFRRPYYPPVTQARPVTCSRGFTLAPDRRTCIDVNECQLGTHTCVETQRCDNTLGSYHCVRMAGCGTGYTYNYANELCEDDDECQLGTHNCGGLGSGFTCRNTLGSYRCDPVKRVKPPIITTSTTTPAPPSTPRPTYFIVTTQPTLISGERKKCLPGYKMNRRGDCEDIDECESNPCARGESCLNLQGRFQCVTKVQCKAGYDLNDAGDGCEDVNECVRGTHKCNPTQLCRNGDGYYTCECPPGHHLNPQTNHCEDIDECRYYMVCHYNAHCINTVGSYRCDCKEGFKNNGVSCEDIDECSQTQNLCEHKCVNVWGSFRCACRAGFTLNRDNRTCSDNDECEEFKDKKLCIGICQNIPGSYKCGCPNGYRLGLDGRTCQDVDECEKSICPNHNDICVNTRGSYKCYTINCPTNYIRDVQHKSRCKRPQTLCDPRDLECVIRPEQYTYHFIAIVSNLPVLNGRITLFQIQGPRFSQARTEFNFRIVNSNCPQGTPRINDNYFRMDLQNYNAMRLYLTRSITGPQEAELEVQMKLFDNNQLTMSAVSRIFIIVTEYPY